VHSVANELWAMDRRSLAISVDVSAPTSIEAAVQQVDAEWARLDILVNTQDQLFARPFDEIGPDEWAATLDTNLTAAALACQAAGRLMVRDHRLHGRGGSIVNVVRAPAPQGGSGFAAYRAASGGLVALSRALAAEWESWGITVNIVEAWFGADQAGASGLEGGMAAGGASPGALPLPGPVDNDAVAATIVESIASGETGAMRSVRMDASSDPLAG
jgi:NAD(P)-dependent dehydrogenase (short-subunit alcohol dehydrogenase family)